jgi:F0F1-type ATP synthase membrane subunit c/vacuolar-type H+-ATPase subunit K
MLFSSAVQTRGNTSSLNTSLDCEAVANREAMAIWDALTRGWSAIKNKANEFYEGTLKPLGHGIATGVGFLGHGIHQGVKFAHNMLEQAKGWAGDIPIIGSAVQGGIEALQSSTPYKIAQRAGQVAGQVTSVTDKLGITSNPWAGGGGIGVY